MLYYDLKKFTLTHINNLSQLIHLLNKNELFTFLQFLFYSNKIQPNYFISQNHFQTLSKNYNKLIKSNTSHYLIINYISNSLKNSDNYKFLLNTLIQLHIYNKPLLQLIINFKSHLKDTLVA